MLAVEARRTMRGTATNSRKVDGRKNLHSEWKMRTCRSEFLVLLILLASTSVRAQDMQRLKATTTFRCAFTVNVATEMRGDSPRPTISRDTFELVFDQVDASKGSGRMVGNQGGADVSVIAADEVITLLEPLGSGAIQMTVIYLAQDSEGRFKAVHSRHTVAPGGNPIPSQYYGSCRALL